jgi:phosphoglycerate dehydrogenase-like enzyme
MTDSTSAATPPARLRLHLENSRARPPLFQMTRAAWDVAAERHAELSAQVDVSIGWDGDIIETALSEAHAMIAGPIDRQRIASAPNLRWLHTTGAGVDHLVPMDWLPAHITVTNSSGIHADKAEDYASMALLMLHNRMPRVIAAQQAHSWEPLHTYSISGKTAVVLGFGDVGQAAGRGAARLGMKVIAVTRSGKAVAPADEAVSVDALDAVLPRADYLIVATPLTPDTRNLIDARRVALLPAGAGLINIGRAPVVDYAAVAHQLESGALSGAMLDVFDKEPLPADAPWWNAPNLIVTPHVSCDAPDYIQRVFDAWFANLARRNAGLPLANQVSRTLGY